jgi:hypothetical protein
VSRTAAAAADHDDFTSIESLHFLETRRRGVHTFGTPRTTIQYYFSAPLLYAGCAEGMCERICLNRGTAAARITVSGALQFSDSVTQSLWIWVGRIHRGSGIERAVPESTAPS